MTKSTHRVEVIRLGPVAKHTNADKLGIVHTYGYICVVGLDQFKEGDLAAYIVPDSVVPPTGPFAFLDKKQEGKPIRIRVARFRGIISQGLLIPAPEGSKEGDDVAEQLGVTRYEPPLDMIAGGEVESPPPVLIPKYDVDDAHRYRHVFKEGEEVVATEKIHGANGRFLFTEGRMWCGSKSEWKKEDPRSIWWLALKNSPWLKEWCESHPDLAVFGEVYGKVQSLRYGIPGGVAMLVYDIWDKSHFLDFEEANEIGSTLRWVPVVSRGPWSWEKFKLVSNGRSLVAGADHIREGIVVKPVKERNDMEIGRVQLKIVSDSYLEKEK